MEAEGTLVWYRSDNNRGVVRLDDGRRYLFHQVKDLENPEPLLRVRVLNVEKGPSGVVVTALKGGGREFGRVPPPRVRGGTKAGDKKVKRNPDAPPDGSPVRHTTYGPGVVIGATAKMIRVRFNEDGKERSVRLTSLTDLAAEEAAAADKAAADKEAEAKPDDAAAS
ncbi:MAG: hypothetical protein VX498_06925 [Myxococcota bacterium]|nr:hypothetical protein [Myxococcota bacterium]